MLRNFYRKLSIVQTAKKKIKKPSKKSLKRKQNSPDHLRATKNPRVRAEYNDFDYAQKLSPEDRAWLAQFAGEYYGAAIDVKKDKSRPFKTAIHQTMDQVKKARDANNHRNNDVYGANRANGLLFDVQNAAETKDGWYITNPELQEMSIIGNLDEKEQEEQLTLVEWLDCRNFCKEEEKIEKDFYIAGNHKLTEKEFIKLIQLYEDKAVNKKRLRALLDTGTLKEFLKNT